MKRGAAISPFHETTLFVISDERDGRFSQREYYLGHPRIRRSLYREYLAYSSEIYPNSVCLFRSAFARKLAHYIFARLNRR